MIIKDIINIFLILFAEILIGPKFVFIKVSSLEKRLPDITKPN